ncbi:YaiI/YqxD family protein [Rhodovibrio salinarum]|uniref:UPF0178 protein CKO21_14405 n=1 Tax=Rhodovibrio salinarum TaxID=1087 RepID=A0A934QK79_9PROT|nr:YaiI/YqxD family protein [Rhodovibrio salinarum]MBK1698437.1 DUF188 domain-containing protein [Rhodovibrio salinarum]
MTEIYIDADACPVKEETLRVARRHKLKTYIVSDGGVRPERDVLVEMVYVASGEDAADNWIAEHIDAGDICVTNDIRLAARCLDVNAKAIKPSGEPFTQAGIGMAVANRNLMADLRETGAVTGGPAPFSKSDRSRFLDKLEQLVRATQRGR